MAEKTAEYVFNSGRAAGKGDGAFASFGKASKIRGRRDYLENLDWGRAFKGKSKQEWEESGRVSFYSDIAASVQQDFEEGLLELARHVRGDFPDYEDVILTGGCALNCTANMKLLDRAIFRQIYVPPFPGDECIGLGAASHLYYSRDRNPWPSAPARRSAGVFPGRSRLPSPMEKTITEAFSGFEIVKPASIVEFASKLLAEGRIIGWFQGRSESGPRALGNRSILADPEGFLR